MACKPVNTFSYNEKLGILTGFYDENLNIDTLHKTVLSILAWRQDKNLASLNEIAGRGLQLLVDDKVDFSSAFSIFSQSVTTVSQFDDRGEYFELAVAHLERIKHAKHELQKIGYIEFYVDFITEYIKTNISYRSKNHSNNKERCDSCSAEILDDAECCGKCGVIICKYLETSAFVDTITAPEPQAKKETVKRPYDKFDEMYRRWKGIFGIEITDDIVNDLRTHMKDKGYELNTDECLWPKNAQFIRKILSETGYTTHLPDTTLVANKLWGRKLPQVTEQIDAKIEKDWEAVQKIFEENKTKDDKITLNYNGWRLWRHIDQVGIECDELEFDVTTNERTKKRLESLWTLARTKLKW